MENIQKNNEEAKTGIGCLTIMFFVLIVWAVIPWGGSDDNHTKKEKPSIGKYLKYEVKALQYDEYSKFTFQQLAGYGFNAYISEDTGKIKEWKSWIPKVKFVKNVEINGMKGKMYSQYLRSSGKTIYMTFFFDRNKAMRVESEDGIRGYDYYMALKESKKIFDHFEDVDITEGEYRYIQPKLKLTEEELNKLEDWWYVANDRAYVPMKIKDEMQYYRAKRHLKETYLKPKVEFKSMQYLGKGEEILATEWELIVTGKNYFNATVQKLVTVKFDRYGNMRVYEN